MLQGINIQFVNEKSHYHGSEGAKENRFSINPIRVIQYMLINNRLLFLKSLSYLIHKYFKFGELRFENISPSDSSGSHYI